MNEPIQTLVSAQRAYFRTNATLPLQARKAALVKLQRAIRAREKDIAAALHADLGKSPEEAYLCEIGMVLSELRHMLRHMGRYAGERTVATPLHQFAARSFTMKRPFGTVLVMSPWNYPFLLTMDPLIGAIAAGNTCIVKPSAYAPATSAIIRELVESCFPKEHAAVVLGGRAENQALLDQHFDKIFFTGGENVGKEVLRHAAERLTPCVLELGGKSPVIVDETADIPLAARRIVFGKLLNAGQTCVAPDYVLVHERVHAALVEALKAEIIRQCGENPLTNPAFPHIVNERHFRRVLSLIDPAKAVCGGQGDVSTLRIAPTVLDHVTPADAVMQEEIFGPVLPVIAYDTMDEAVRFIGSRPHPLALYLFSEDKAVQQRFLDSVPYGGGCINDVIIHLATSRMGFGGVGESGMGSYHGKLSFDTFSHEKSIVHKSSLIDLPFRYMPYATWKDALIRMFLK